MEEITHDKLRPVSFNVCKYIYIYILCVYVCVSLPRCGGCSLKASSAYPQEFADWVADQIMLGLVSWQHLDQPNETYIVNYPTNMITDVDPTC